jgi:dUTP pyrophosphatase
MTLTHIQVAIRRFPGAEDIPLPSYQSAGSAAMDLHAAVPVPLTIQPSDLALVPCGFAMALPAGYEAQIRPRSGVATKHAVIIPNSPGTIDADYRGEVKVALLNLGREPFTVTRGMRIAQLLVVPVPRVEWSQQQQLDETERGAGGFGHTGR